jgi:glycosyltransferase involved in cell wall biosynthesis
MNVLMLTTEFLPTLGGISTYVVELCKRMPPDINVHVVTPKSSLGQQAEAAADHAWGTTLPKNVSVHNLGKRENVFFGTFPFQVNCRTNLRRILKDYDVDLIHSQSSMPDFLVSPSRVDVPIITTIHTTIEGHVDALRQSHEGFFELNAQEKFAMAFGPALCFLENTYYESNRKFLTVSEWGKSEAVRQKGIDEKSIRVAYNGVDTSVYRPDLPDRNEKWLELADNSECPTVLFLSRLATRKGIHVLAEAIPKVLRRVDCRFIIAGIGKPPQIESHGDRVKLLGYVPTEYMPELYARADIYVLPSYYENFPISILEAMASECAVAATDVCGIPEMIEHGIDGLLMPPGDADRLAETIETLVEDDEMRMSFGKMARQKVQDRFNWSMTTAITSEYYRDVVSGKA